MKHVYITILLISILISCGKKEQKVKPRIGTITESVYASGFVKAQNQYNVISTVTGKLQKAFVTEGDTVRKGDPILLIDNQTSVLNTDNARVALELSEENVKSNSNRLRELVVSVRLAKEKLHNDSSLLVRQKNLWQQNVGSKIELEQRHLAFETSKTNYLATLSKFKQAKTQFDAEYRQAKNNLRINQEIQGNYLIKSEIDGLVYSLPKEPGELVTTQSPVAVLGSFDKFLVQLEVDEYDIVKIQAGQKILISMDSYKGKSFEARVTKVYPIMNERSRTFTVEGEFTEAPPILYPNLTLEANILISTKKEALIVPRDYLVDSNHVWVEDDKKVKVKTGLSDFEYVEILSGVDTSQYLYKR